MSFARKVLRRALREFEKMTGTSSERATRANEARLDEESPLRANKLPSEGERPAVRLGLNTHAEALAMIRGLPIPPGAPGAPSDLERDKVDPIGYRREKNRAKRARRARGASARVSRSSNAEAGVTAGEGSPPGNDRRQECDARDEAAAVRTAAARTQGEGEEQSASRSASPPNPRFTGGLT